MNGFPVPIAVLNFNRPVLTRRLFGILRTIRPRRLLLVADGPRPDRPDDAPLCEEVRRVFDGIDWECQVERNFADRNMGSFRRNTSGLDWIFELEDQAIVLEDDCIPSPSFFPYCAELLERYRDDPTVAAISGNHFGRERAVADESSYYFSSYALTWGWASWRRVWKQVDLSMSWWNGEGSRELLGERLVDAESRRYWQSICARIHRGEMKNAWDYQMILSMLLNRQLCAVPRVNLVSNVGFGADGTHCRDPGSRLHDVPRGDLVFPLRHPEDVVSSAPDDLEIFRRRFRPSTVRRISEQMYRLFRRARGVAHRMIRP